MKAIRIGSLVAALALSCVVAGQGQESDQVNGQVLDAEGNPVAGIVVSPYWISEGGRWTTRTGWRTDSEGRFSFNVRHAYGRLMALDETQEHGAIVTFDPKVAADSVVLQLKPTTLVRAAYTCEDLGYEIEHTYVSFVPQGTRMAVAAHRGAPSFELRLPPADFAATAGGVDCQRFARRVAVTPDERVLDLGTTDLKATVIARHYGKEPPAWTVSDVRGLPDTTTLADFRGQWVLLEFWGFW